MVYLQLLVHVTKCYISAVLFQLNGQYDISAIKGLFKNKTEQTLSGVRGKATSWGITHGASDSALTQSCLAV